MNVEKHKNQTPLMRQYWSIKSQHRDKILLFRMGDFYEMFYEDAQISAPLLNITLTTRNKKQSDTTPMCGFPYHSLSEPVGKLLSHGYKVAICDQVENPQDKDLQERKRLVRREVTQVLTPGMVYDPQSLDELSAYYICAYDEKTLCFWDVSTSEAFYYEYETESQKSSLISLLSPVEIVLTKEQASSHKMKTHVSVFNELLHSPHEYRQYESIERLLSYVERLQNKPQHKFFEKKSLCQSMKLLPEVFRHLEIFKNTKGEIKGSLFFILNQTQTPMGARCLKKWLKFPLLEKSSLEKRYNRVEAWIKKQQELNLFRKALKLIGDLERKLYKASQKHSLPRDMVSLAESLERAHKAYTFLNPEIKPLAIQKEIKRVMRDFENLPSMTKEGGFIRKGVSKNLDELMGLSFKSQKLLNELEMRERQKTGISSLKIKYNNVFGYSIEVTKTHKKKVPERYQIRQTLTQAERYVTDELCTLEEKILTAHSRKVELEKKIFEDLKTKVLSVYDSVLEWACYLGKQDVLANFSWLSLEKSYTRPQLGGGELNLSHSRHPVVEGESLFVPNNIFMKEGEAFLITGPNMAGKSTLMRQVALCAFMAQIGCFIPSEKAKLPIYESIFTRIGANDFLSEGLSTFMVEMKETGRILKLASKRSLVIIDEVGRGTSTYDGMSLAYSILEFLVTHLKPHVFFATHYHELSRIEKKYAKVKNFHMSISEEENKLLFLYTLQRGVANRSYGIQVAELAGLPIQVIEKSKKILFSLEKNSHHGKKVSQDSTKKPSNLFQYKNTAFLEALNHLNLNQMTPLEALNWLGKWQKKVKNLPT